MTKSVTNSTNKGDSVYLSSNDMFTLLSSNEVLAEFGEAVASLVLRNPAVMWAKFILTDDLPNGNGMRVPKTEFSNIIKTGVHMPVKMVEGSVDNHENSKPLGVITNLIEKEEDGHNKIFALAALWHKERPSDVEYIKNRIAAHEPVDVSWELLYENTFTADDGVLDLLGLSLAAATVVRDPAYEGRTPFLAVAAKAKRWSPAYIDLLNDQSFLYVQGEERHFPILDKEGNIEEERLSLIKEEIASSTLPKKIIKQVENAVQILENKFGSGADLESINKDAKTIISSLEEITEDKLDELEKLTKRVSELETELESVKKERDEAVSALTEKETTLSEKETKLAELEEYKASIESEVEKQEKLNSLKQKFNDAGIEKEETYFDENLEALLALDPTTLDFMLQEMLTFSSKEQKGEKKEEKSSKLPNFKVNEDEEVDVKNLAKSFKELRAK